MRTRGTVSSKNAKSAKTELSSSLLLSYEWKDSMVVESLYFILYSSVLKKRYKMDMKITKHCCKYVCVNTFKSKATVILTG